MAASAGVGCRGVVASGAAVAVAVDCSADWPFETPLLESICMRFK